MVAGSALNEVGSVAFNNLPERFVPGEASDLGITITEGMNYGFQVAAVFSDETQAGVLTTVFDATIVNEAEKKIVTFELASNSSNSNSAPMVDAINALKSSIPVELTEKLYFARFANGEGLISQISPLRAGSDEAVNLKLKLLDDDGIPLNVFLNGEMVSGEIEIFRIAAGGSAVSASDGEGPLVPGSVTVRSDGPLSGVVVCDGGAFDLGVAGVGSGGTLTEEAG